MAWQFRIVSLSGIFLLAMYGCGGGGGSTTAVLSAEGAVAHSVVNAAPLVECLNGGITVHSGIDTNGNGVLDSSEITSTQYVCHGADGATGPTGADGLVALVAVEAEAPGSNCPYGGYQVNVGLDSNNNETLDPSEITSTDYVCHGAGYNAPTADAGPDQRVAAAGVEVTLDGSSSSDPYNSGLTYQWGFISRPVGSLAALSSTGEQPKFTPDKAGRYELSLVVSNETATSPPDTVTVWAGMPIPDTGQTRYYSTAFGDDGDYTINPMSFTDNGDGTILDNVTGLTWQKCSLGRSGMDCDDGTAATTNWFRAVGEYDATRNPESENVCGNLSLAGGGWRLPTRLELLTIVNYGRHSPAIDTAYFPRTSSFFWSSTTYAPGTSNAWRVYFNYGYTYNASKTLDNYVRCVRGE